MALVQVRTLVGSTGASGLAGFTGLMSTHNTAIATAVTTASQVANCVVASISILNTQLIQDANAGTLEIFTCINYITSV